MSDAAVIQREVADHAHAPCVHLARQRAKGVVAAQQRVDAIEARRVVPMRASRRKERRQVDDIRAERLDVPEVLLDAGQVTAEQLAARVLAAALGPHVPGAWYRPLGRLALGAARRKP